MIDKDTVIYVISTTCLEVPPSTYGGTEQIVYNLSHELGRRGYDVSCIAPQGTEIENVDIIETVPSSSDTGCSKREQEAFDIYGEYLPSADIVIDHTNQKWVYSGKDMNPEFMEDTAILGVWHQPPVSIGHPPVEHPCFISVSRAAAKAWTDATGIETRHAYNGIDVDNYPLEADKENYFMTLNRIMDEKGIKECVQVANQVQVPMKIVGEDQFVSDPGYVHEVMRMCADSDYAEYIGSVEHEEKLELLKHAKGLVLLPKHPYLEVFGLAAVESLACGTPVVCLDNCGLGEIVKTVQSVDGSRQARHVCDNYESVKASIEAISNDVPVTLEPSTLRRRVQERFSKETMVAMYRDRMEQALDDPW